MNETAPQEPVDYLQAHPNAIEDQAKAEVMAYASHEQEEVLVQERSKALDAASNIGNIAFRGEGNRGAAHAASHHSELAQKARTEADKQSTAAASVYDIVTKL